MISTVVPVPVVQISGFLELFRNRARWALVLAVLYGKGFFLLHWSTFLWCGCVLSQFRARLLIELKCKPFYVTLLHGKVWISIQFGDHHMPGRPSHNTWLNGNGWTPGVERDRLNPGGSTGPACDVFLTTRSYRVCNSRYHHLRRGIKDMGHFGNFGPIFYISCPRFRLPSRGRST